MGNIQPKIGFCVYSQYIAVNILACKQGLESTGLRNSDEIEPKTNLRVACCNTQKIYILFPRRCYPVVGILAKALALSTQGCQTFNSNLVTHNASKPYFLQGKERLPAKYTLTTGIFIWQFYNFKLDASSDILQHPHRGAFVYQWSLNVPLLEYRIWRDTDQREMLGLQMESHKESGEGHDCCVLVNYFWPHPQEQVFLTICSSRSPPHPEVLSTKRVIGLEGDTVYTRAPYPYPTAVVPKNHVWVEGDNKDGSKTLDSNTYGPIAMPLIQGRITHVLWPWKSIGPVNWQEFRGRARVIRGRKENAPNFD